MEGENAGPWLITARCPACGFRGFRSFLEKPEQGCISFGIGDIGCRMQLIRKFLEAAMVALGRLVFRRPWQVLIVALLVTVLGAYIAATRFKVLNNVNQLMDDDSEVLRNYKLLEKEFGTDEVYLILIQSPDPVRNREVAVKVGQHLETLKPYISRSLYRMDYSRLRERLLFLLPKEQLESIEKEIGENAEALRKSKTTFNLNSVLDEANAGFDEKYLRKAENWKEFAPFIERFKKILNELADRLEGKVGESPSVKSTGFQAAAEGGDQFQDADAALTENEFISFEQGKSLLVMGVRGELEVDSISPFSSTVKSLREYLAGLGQEYPDVKLGLTGQPVLNDDELTVSTQDTELAAIITFALIAGLFFFSYRNLERPVMALIVLGMGMAWTLGFTMLGVGHFNVISFAVIPMVMGLGIDFGIQLLSRYEEELHAGKSPEIAIGNTMRNTGVAIITGATTTSTAFFTLCFNQFLGLRELGLIAGASVLLCLVANLFVLPALFCIRDRKKSAEKLVQSGNNSNWSGLAFLDDWLVRAPRSVLVASVVITLLSFWGIGKVQFDYNLLNLQNKEMESVKVLKEIFRASGNSTLFASVMVDSVDEAREMQKKLEALPTVSRVDSVTSLLPDQQEAKLPVVRRIVDLMKTVRVDTDVSNEINVQKARKDIEALLESSREGQAQASKYKMFAQARQAEQVLGGLIPPLERAQKAMAGLSQEELGRRMNKAQVEVFGAMQKNLLWMKTQKADRVVQLEDLPEGFLQQFVAPSGRIVLQVYSKEDVWEREANVAFVDELRSVAPQVTGTPVSNYEYIELMRTSFLAAAVWAFVAIVVITSFHFMSWKTIVLAISPLVLAVIWRTGLMGWWPIAFNPANIVTLPLIIGIDVAYGVYLVDRFREDGRLRLFSTSTGKAIIMTGLTTMFGFVSLLISRYEGMYSIGLLMTIGIAIGMVTTLVVLPQILIFLEKKK